MTNPTVISTAANEYYRRPKDERYASPEALVAFSRQRKANSRELAYNLKDLRIQPADEQRVVLASPKGTADLTPWSHAQLCRTVGAPASYIRTLPAHIAADALNFGLQATAPGTVGNILAERKTDGTITARSVTSQSYGRLWDADTYGPTVDHLCGKGWTTPPTWDGEPAGAYAGDRDSFLLLCEGGSIVNDPSVSNGNGQMYRALMIRNSEVGHCAATVETVLYQWVCGNHNLWGAVMDKSYRRVHRGTNVLRDVLRQIGTIARQWSTRPASADEQIIRQLIDLELAHTREACVDELVKMGCTKTDAETAYATCEQHFDASPRSFWGLSQGFTKSSQASGHQDDRLSLDSIAAKLLAKGRARVAA